MHRNVRRKDREVSIDIAVKLLVECEYGVLSTTGSDGQPYGIPLNFVYKDNCIYFHCALEGHKLENIRANNRVSFCVVGRSKVLPDKFSTAYESAIAFGEAYEVHGRERHDALLSFIEKYSPDFIEEGKKAIGKYNDRTTVIRIDITHITGKASK